MWCGKLASARTRAKVKACNNPMWHHAILFIRRPRVGYQTGCSLIVDPGIDRKRKRNWGSPLDAVRNGYQDLIIRSRCSQRFLAASGRRTDTVAIVEHERIPVRTRRAASQGGCESYICWLKQLVLFGTCWWRRQQEHQQASQRDEQPCLGGRGPSHPRTLREIPRGSSSQRL